MATREVAFTEEQLRLIRRWADREWTELDQERMTSRPDSPQEASLLADQLDVQMIKEKLAGRR